MAFDGFFVHFAKYFGFNSDKTTSEILDPETYGKLNECFSSPNERQQILVEYVNGWAQLGQKEQLYITGEHKNPENKYFEGYWCFLGAAVAKMLNIDDSPLRDHADYPYDLVHYDQT